MTRLRSGRPRNLSISCIGQDVFLDATISGADLVKRPWRVANHSPASSVEVKNECSCKFTSVSPFVVVASLGATWRLGCFAEVLARGDWPRRVGRPSVRPLDSL